MHVDRVLNKLQINANFILIGSADKKIFKFFIFLKNKKRFLKGHNSTNRILYGLVELIWVI